MGGNINGVFISTGNTVSDSCRSMIGAMLALALSIEDDGTSLHKDPRGSGDL